MMNSDRHAFKRMHLRTSLKDSLSYSLRPLVASNIIIKNAGKRCHSKSRQEIVWKYGVGCYKS